MTSFRDAAMIERFVDTSGWAEWADQTLLFHAQAATLFEEVWNKRGPLSRLGVSDKVPPEPSNSALPFRNCRLSRRSLLQ